MAFVAPKDRVLEHSTSNSQTVFAVTGAVDTSYKPFSASMSIGDTTIGAVVEPGVAFVSAVLTYSAANQLTVLTVLESNGLFSSTGTKDVFMGLPASRALLSDRPVALTDTTPSTSTTTGALKVAGGAGIAGQATARNFATANVAASNPSMDCSGSGSIGTGAALTSAFPIVPSGTPNYYKIIISEVAVNGASAEYLVSNNTVALGTSIGSIWVASSTTPASGKCSVAFDGASQVNVYNNLSTGARFRVTAIKLT